MLGAAVDRLLQWGLRRFIRRGNLRVTTASGRFFHFGDGSGAPVALRFTSAAAQRAVMLDPEVKLGEAYMDGTLQIEEGTIADLLALVLGQTPDGMPPVLGSPAMVRPLSQPPAAAVQPAVPGAAQCRAPLRSRRPALFAVPRCRPAIQLRLFRGRPISRSTTRNSPRSAISPPSSSLAKGPTAACSTSAAAGAGSRFISPSSAARRSPASRCRASSWRSPGSAPAKRT